MENLQGGNLISQIHKLTGRKINEYLKTSGISEFNGAQGTIIYSLWGKDNLTIKEISKITGLAKTTLSSMLERMEKQGLIKKQENLKDKRSSLISLTGKTKKLANVYKDICEKMLYEYYYGFDEEEIIEFENYLKRILNNLERKNGKK